MSVKQYKYICHIQIHWDSEKLLSHLVAHNYTCTNQMMVTGLAFASLKQRSYKFSFLHNIMFKTERCHFIADRK